MTLGRKKKIKLHSRCYLSPRDGRAFCNSETPGPRSTPHEVPDAGGLRALPPCSLGNLSEQAKGTAPLFTASFLPHTALTRKPQQTITAPLVCAAKLLLEAGTCGLPDLGLSTPLLSCPLIFLFHVAPLCLSAVGHLSHSMQVTCIPSQIREVSTPGKVGLLRFRPLHSQNTTWTEGKG